MQATKQSAVRFFHQYAGLSWDPKTETKAQARMRVARALARAEREACERGWSCEWEIDQESTSDDWDTSGREPYEQWACVLRDENGKVLQSLCGIDFGPGVEPWGQPYRRLVEAELALEAL